MNKTQEYIPPTAIYDNGEVDEEQAYKDFTASHIYGSPQASSPQKKGFQVTASQKHFEYPNENNENYNPNLNTAKKKTNLMDYGFTKQKVLGPNVDDDDNFGNNYWYPTNFDYRPIYMESPRESGIKFEKIKKCLLSLPFHVLNYRNIPGIKQYCLDQFKDDVYLQPEKWYDLIDDAIDIKMKMTGGKKRMKKTRKTKKRRQQKTRRR